MMQRNVLIIEDQNVHFNWLKACIEEIPSLKLIEGNAVSPTLKDALNYIDYPGIEIIFLDNELGNERQASVEFLRKLKEFYENQGLRKPCVIICTSYPEPTQVPDVFKNVWSLGINEFISKPTDSQTIARKLAILEKNGVLKSWPVVKVRLNVWSLQDCVLRFFELSSDEILFIQTDGNYTTYYRTPNLLPAVQKRYEKLELENDALLKESTKAKWAVLDILSSNTELLEALDKPLSEQLTNWKENIKLFTKEKIEVFINLLRVEIIKEKDKQNENRVGTKEIEKYRMLRTQLADLLYVIIPSKAAVINYKLFKDEATGFSLYVETYTVRKTLADSVKELGVSFMKTTQSIVVNYAQVASIGNDNSIFFYQGLKLE
jgi:DNA-binding LytR/AlgR family response regulator